MTEPIRLDDPVHLDGYKLAHQVTRTKFRTADPAKILAICGIKKLWRTRIGPYVLTLTKID